MSTSNDTPDFITIQLTQGYSTTVDVADADLARFNWHIHIGITGRVYAVRKVITRLEKPKQKKQWMHQVVCQRAYGKLEKGFVVDHIDNNPLNNTRGNLRIATKSQNLLNSKLFKSKILPKGVTYHKRDKKYQAKITVDKKQYHLGNFDNPEDASKAYQEAATRYFGEFSRFE